MTKRRRRTLKHGTKFVTFSEYMRMLMKSLFENVSRMLLTVNCAIKFRNPVIEPELSNKMTMSFEHVAVSIYHERFRPAETYHSKTLSANKYIYIQS